MPSFKLTATLLFVGALVLFQAGCLGPSKNPPTRFYVLSSLHSLGYHEHSCENKGYQKP